MSSSVRVLVVDDYELFRRFVCSTLAKRQDLQIVGEATDGLEAVRIAEELQPDMILLDIGLPKLNGLEVANRISPSRSGAKIIFLTSNKDKDIVRAAFEHRGARLRSEEQMLEGAPYRQWQGFLAGNDFVSSGIQPE